MQEINEEAQQPGPPAGCHNCSSPETEEGYLTPLCRECRKKLSRYPVLKSVKLAAAGVGILFLISLYNFPRYFKAGVTYKKALNAEASHLYVTEKKLLKQVLQQFPDNFEAGTHYLIASINNDDIMEADSLLQQMGGAQDDNQELINKANEKIEGLQYFRFAEDSFAVSISKIADTSLAYKQAVEGYSRQHPGDVCAAYVLGQFAYNSGDYGKADTILSRLVEETPDFRIAKCLLSNVYRQEKLYEKGLQQCNDVLQQNAESCYALTSAAKILLKQKHDKEALEKAMMAYELEPESYAAQYTLTLADHFNNRTTERDRLYEKIKARKETDPDVLAELDEIISGKKNYR